MADWLAALDELANLAGVETGYWEVDGTHHVAPPEVLVVILRALGVEIERPEEARAALARARAAHWRRPLEPCAAVRSGRPSAVALRMDGGAGGRLEVNVALESGGEMRTDVDAGELPIERATEVDGARVVQRRLALPADLPVGYHQLRVSAAGLAASCQLLVAPERAWRGPGEMRTWGVFAPVYALRSPGQLGVGDLGDLAALCRMVGGHGGALVGTLPLLACFYGEPFSPSPYSPVSRLHWNEILADLRPEAWLALGLPGAAQLADPTFAQAAELLAGEPLVDYRRVGALKRAALDRVAAEVWSDPAARARVEDWLAERPGVEDYARFRAMTETMARPWQLWPEAARDGKIAEGEYAEEARRAHGLGQFVMNAQLADIKAGRDVAGLYLDLPVGVEGRGYDLWRERASFAMEMSVGAPPDPLARSGQNWAVPPLHPVRQRDSGYRYFIECVRTHMEHAAMMRIDHVMGLHRLFWIPPGGGAPDGVYVRYPADELYAVLAIESHRQRCAVAGEDLGTVPDTVRPMMAERGLHGLFVAEFEWSWQDGRAAVHRPRPGTIACLDTHDTPTFAGFAAREGIPGAEAVMWRWSEELAAGPADVFLATLEDIWLEREPQNVPGTFGDEAANWRRRMQLDMAQIANDPRVQAMFSTVAAARRR
ncbi:MAG TPA: 4-alpha-glucanotransferase [Kofleriaceae bacterium]|nr:4-alpha-glucanotransferase [Kofleriaceae bacterium]